MSIGTKAGQGKGQHFLTCGWAISDLVLFSGVEGSYLESEAVFGPGVLLGLNVNKAVTFLFLASVSK